MKFYLGSCEAYWLDYSTVPLFLSYRRMIKRNKFKPSSCNWALDSGGFSELSLYGAWTIHPRDYAYNIRRYESEIGNLDFCAIQDYMCEPHILKKTGLSVLQHQYLTCCSYLVLKNYNPHTNFIPILQGWTLDDYLRHIDLYYKFNIDLLQFPTVGVGSVCRRQSTDEIENIIRTLSSVGINIHGFGVKINGLKRYGNLLTSADSMAWSYKARYSPAMEGHTHRTCNNCIEYATNWYHKVISKLN